MRKRTKMNYRRSKRNWKKGNRVNTLNKGRTTSGLKRGGTRL